MLSEDFWREKCRDLHQGVCLAKSCGCYQRHRSCDSQGAEVIIVSRGQDNCAAAVEQIKQQIGQDEVKYFVADLSSQQSVRQLANDFKKQYQRLEVFVRIVVPIQSR